MRLFFFFRLCSKLNLVSFGFSFVIKAWVLQAVVIIDWSFLRLIQRLKVVKIIVAVATAIVCEETESSEESSEKSSDGTDSPESDSSLWTTQIPLTKLMQFSGETTGTEIVLKRFQVSFSLLFFRYFSSKPSFESSIIFDWSSVDRRFRPESKYVRAGQVLVWPAILVMEHIASSALLQTLIWHLKVIDSVADEPRVAPVKANCLLYFQNLDFCL